MSCIYSVHNCYSVSLTVKPKREALAKALEKVNALKKEVQEVLDQAQRLQEPLSLSVAEKGLLSKLVGGAMAGGRWISK